MTLLNREAVLGAMDLPTERVSVPEWGGEVLLRGLTAGEFDALQQEYSTPQDDGSYRFQHEGFRIGLLSKCLVDEEGRNLLAPGDFLLLAHKSNQVLSRLFDVAARLSGLGGEHTPEKNANGAGAASTTGLPMPSDAA